MTDGWSGNNMGDMNQNIDEAIERLSKIAELLRMEDEEQHNADLRALAMAIVALSDMKDGGWISVFDSLPPYLTDCIVYTQDNRCCVACLSEVDEKWYDENDSEVSADWWRDMLPYPPDTPYED